MKETRSAERGRITACVNACHGIPQEQLEDAAPGIIKRMVADEMRRITAQRNELLEALQGMYNVCQIALTGKSGLQYSYFETRDGHFVHATTAMVAAEYAIAKATGANHG